MKNKDYIGLSATNERVKECMESAHYCNLEAAGSNHVTNKKKKKKEEECDDAVRIARNTFATAKCLPNAHVAFSFILKHKRLGFSQSQPYIGVIALKFPYFYHASAFPYLGLLVMLVNHRKLIEYKRFTEFLYSSFLDCNNSVWE